MDRLTKKTSAYVKCLDPTLINGQLFGLILNLNEPFLFEIRCTQIERLFPSDDLAILYS